MPEESSSEKPEQNTERFSSEKSKTDFWNSFAQKHLPEMRMLFMGGKLWKKEGWRNVVEHSLPQGAAVEVLSDMLQLPQKEKIELITAAICHDWDKRLEKKPDDFTKEDTKEALSMIKKMGISQKNLAATKLDFAKKIVSADKLKKDVPIIQLLMFYIDRITFGGEGGNVGEIVSFEDRLAEARRRAPELSPEFWDDEIKAAHIAQNKIYELLKEREVLIEKPEDIPALVRDTIKGKYNF